MSKGTILLAEDDPNDVVLFQRAMERAFLRLDSLKVVRDGEEAISYLSGQGIYADRDLHPLPALLLLDLKMPRKSGLEVLSWIRKQPQLRYLIVVFLTSSNSYDDIRLAYETGANSYLVKPVEFTEMVEMIRNVSIYWLEINEKLPLTGTMPSGEGGSKSAGNPEDAS
jgi:CheY-like chemotaxis protein